MHAQVLNRVVSEMKEAAEDPSSYDSIDEKMGGVPLKEVLGHTPRQASDLFYVSNTLYRLFPENLNPYRCSLVASLAL